MADEIQTPPETIPVSDDKTVISLRAQLAAADRKVTAQAAEVTKYQQLMAEKEFATRELTDKYTAATTKQTTYEQQLLEATTARDKASAEAANLAKTIDRQKLFMAEYPDLAEWEAKGRFRTDLEGDALKTYLTDIRSDFKTLGQSAVVSTMKGAIPPATPPQDAGQPNLDMLNKEFDMLMNRPVHTNADKERIAQLTVEISRASTK